MNTGHLHLLCGLMGSGKSTLARQLVDTHKAVLIEEDVWAATLWPGELVDLGSYRDRSTRLRGVLWPHVRTLVESGLTVVLDFAANTRGQRRSLAKLISEGHFGHTLHVLETPKSVCKSRLIARNAHGEHPYQTDMDTFELFARYYEPPSDDEGFILHPIPYRA
ncbi:AAA family ATPase [Maricaulis sp. D1M11]|uniref:AAA family ATPase n=1 Tax=Maricaulis sp. D1M11 TaxID=3076117 RepID=UPI0039B52F72